MEPIALDELVIPASLRLADVSADILRRELTHLVLDDKSCEGVKTEIKITPTYFTYEIVRLIGKQCKTGEKTVDIHWTCEERELSLPYALELINREKIEIKPSSGNEDIIVEVVTNELQLGGIPWICIKNKKTNHETLIKTGFSPVHRIRDTVNHYREKGTEEMEFVNLPNGYVIPSLLRFAIIESALYNNLSLCTDDETRHSIDMKCFLNYLKNECNISESDQEKYITVYKKEEKEKEEKIIKIDSDTFKNICEGIKLDLTSRVFSSTDDSYIRQGEKQILEGNETSLSTTHEKELSCLHSYIRECMIPREKKSSSMSLVSKEMRKFPPFVLSIRHTGWNKENTSTSHVVVVSPHPDDDAIGMGAAMAEMHKEMVFNSEEDLDTTHHTTTVTNVYCVSGASATKAEGPLREFIFRETQRLKNGTSSETTTTTTLFEKDSNALAAIRRCEATDCIRTLADSPACRRGVTEELEPPTIDTITCQYKTGSEEMSHKILRVREKWSIPSTSNIHTTTACFAELPFYNYKARVLLKDDKGEPVDALCCSSILSTIPKEQRVVFLAGDLSDPHLAHLLSFKSMLYAIEKFNKAHVIFASFERVIRNPPLFNTEAITSPDISPVLYRSAWSPSHVSVCSSFLLYGKRVHKLKNIAIQRHISQHHPAMCPGSYEFYDMAANADRQLARELYTLGVIDVEVYCEGFELGICTMSD